MSRQFNGTSSTLRCSAGDAAGLRGTNATVAMLWRPLAVASMGLLGTQGTGAVSSVNPFSDGLLYYTGGSSTFVASPYSYSAADGWRLDVVTCPTGTTATPRWHKYLYSSTGWTHADSSGTVSQASAGSVTGVELGLVTAFGAILNGRIAAIAVWTEALTDDQVATLHTGLSAWTALTPAACWPLNQSATTTAVVDITGGGADQTTQSDTSVSADEPDLWSYSLSLTAALNPATEATAARPLERVKTRPLSAATTTETSQPLARIKMRTLGLATAADTAQPLTRVKTRALGVAVATGTARPLSRAKTRTLGTAAVVDIARPLTHAGAATVTPGTLTPAGTAPTLTAAGTTPALATVGATPALAATGAFTTTLTAT